MPEPKKRGRPPKAKEPEPKPKKRMGRPTLWDESHGNTRYKTITAPKRFFDLWCDEETKTEFRSKINDLMLTLLQ